MARENLNDLLIFLVVARERSFTRAAGQLGISQSALSHTVRALEERLGVRLLTRTTRSVAPTEMGERLIKTIGPQFDQIDSEVTSLAEYRDRPGGKLRITSSDHAAKRILGPCLRDLLPAYPDIKVEIAIDYGLVDIVAERFDAGIRLGDQVAKDMIATRIGPDIRMVVVGSPAYLASAGIPREPQDLLRHNCINLRLPTYGGYYAWELKKGDRAVQVRVDGQLAFNNIYQVQDAALAGHGLACLADDMALEHVRTGHLQFVLEDWFQSFSGFHLYYPNRHQSGALRVLIDALRYDQDHTPVTLR
ncbi:LysR family transcriptional regulator [Herbaspirillum sp. alder98]|uniref:LysR family transcriptional regulator n=1 Tax=Herbaspirillum sp. alder98 TaxID=2913096 RepID=UPI001CD8F32A|nr:LysR family transcriptional regulator [Herbaspirillum sp. alder98]MCA1323780.1 LysR family transcriptional regulator [Herbaspirillum sp. alder98]